jgi:hypothetical protein
MPENICSACNKASVDSLGLEFHTFVCADCHANPPIPEGWRRLAVDEEVEATDRRWDNEVSSRHAEWDVIDSSYFGYMNDTWCVDVDEVIIRKLPKPRDVTRPWANFLESFPQPRIGCDDAAAVEFLDNLGHNLVVQLREDVAVLTDLQMEHTDETYTIATERSIQDIANLVWNHVLPRLAQGEEKK